ncbi:MAG: aromatic ring-hydroxylating dioxygenase subunit alpha [Deltaproteobacteria bacterium]|nr:aromatic ring-hydroxylating dioxygenase subunit alpha [Deltaproteobacteria bacterium]
MTETTTGSNRSAGINYLKLLDEDSHPVRDIMRVESPIAPGPTRVPVERYFSKEFHDIEVEKLWKRVWQMACHQDDIPDVGDYLAYSIAHLNFLIVRSGPDEIKAYHNACPHRGRLLRESRGKRAKVLRCAFHGWAWNLDGSINEIPCRWDFPYLKDEEVSLHEVKVGRWSGFVFINPDPDAEPLEDYLGNLSDQFTLLPYEQRYKSAHVAKLLRCNWKVAQEAFSEAYHVVATHPQIMGGIGDANTKYDVFGNYSRAMSGNGTPSPHIAKNPPAPLEGALLYKKLRHPLSGHIYERRDDGLVCVTDHDGHISIFKEDATWIEGPITQADPNMCDWIGGKQLPMADSVPGPGNGELPPGKNLREVMAAPAREALRKTLGDQVDNISDAELLDSIYLTVFPNFHPWGSFNQIVYRFRPYGDNPDQCIQECMYFSPAPPGKPRPPAAPIHWLGFDDDWVEAPELGMLAKVFNQDVYNMPHVQAGLKAMVQPFVMFADYGETKPRHFHELLEKWVTKP